MAKRHGPRTPVVLIVLDGWGFRPGQTGNAIELGRTPTWHRLWAKAPRTLLNASGLAVGLPESQIGNSEVGHLTLGAGRVVPQDIVRISQAIDSGAFFHIPALVELCGELRRTGHTLHLLGLIGNGGVHALDHHLVAAVMLGHLHELPVAIHAWLDGRDTTPQSGLPFMQELVDLLARHGGRAVISTVVGRYYAMDRDKRWERTKVAYDAMVHGVGEPARDPRERRAPGLRGGRDGRVREAADRRGDPPHPGRGRRLLRQLPRRPYAPDRARARARRVRRLRHGPAATGPACDHDSVRRDLPVPGRVRAGGAVAHRRPGPLGARQDDVPHCRDREVRPRHLLLQLRRRDPVSRRRARPRPLPESPHLRPHAGDERPRRHRRPLQGDRGEAARLHPLQLRQRGHGGAFRGTKRGREGGRGRGRLPRARARECGAGRRDAARHGGPRQLRADDRPDDRRPAHGPHHKPGSVAHRGGRREGPLAARRCALRPGPDAAAPARLGAAGGDDGAGAGGGGVVSAQPVRRLGGQRARRSAPLAIPGLLTAYPPNRLSAQVGHEPGQSPYRDIRRGGVVVFGVGYLGGSRGRVGVGMSDGITWNVHYDASLGGPVSASLGLAYAQTTRYLVDPAQGAATRTQGPVDTDVILADIGLQLVLTGRKTWHGFAPYLGGGIGVADPGRPPSDLPGSKFPTKNTPNPPPGGRGYPTARRARRA